MRYAVGIVLTFISGKYIIQALQHYLEKQRDLETQPETIRKQQITYDMVLTRLNKNICPCCERPIHQASDNFCPHCGMHLFAFCNHCDTRKIIFAPFCFHCGEKTGKGFPH